jgi:hypothetical protein
MSVIWRATVTWKYSSDNAFAQNVIYLEDPSETKTADYVGSKVELLWWGGSSSYALRRMTASAVQLWAIDLQKVHPLPVGGSIPYTPTRTTGAITSANAWHYVVGIVFTIYDGGAGPRHRGRVYHYGTSNTTSLRMGPAGADLTNFPVLRDQWLNDFGPLPTSLLNWVIWHRDLTGTAKFTRVTDIRMQPFFGVQRRRTFGRGL